MFAQQENFRDTSHFSYYEKPQLGTKSTVEDQGPNGQTLISWQPNWNSSKYVAANQSTANICPSCTKIVLQAQSQLACRSPQNKIYLAHSHCLQDLPYYIETGPRAKKIGNIQPFISYRTSLGQQKYFVTISIHHPLSKKRLFRTTKDLTEYRQKIYYTPSNDEETTFSENFIIAPMKQFKFSLSLDPHSQKQTKRQRLIFDVDLSDYQNGVHNVHFEQDGIIFLAEMEIILDNKVKQKIIDQMNIIYKRPYEKQQWVLVKRFSVEFKSLSIFLNPQNSPTQEKYQNYTNISVQIGHEEETEQFDIKRASQIQFVPVQSEFIALIKTQAGSKQFQKKVKNFQKYQTDKVIADIIPFLEQIVLDNYANYMFQSLLSVCSYEQRMIIIENIGEKISTLVCQQQGTFVFQQLILLLTNAEEFQLICKYIERNFQKVAQDNYGFHFLRKLFEKMPVEQIMQFLPTIFKKFTSFSTNKNAIFIMKCSLNCLVALQNTSTQASVKLKNFLDLIASNVPKLINDQFGNYLIQQAFEKVNPEKIKGIFDYIIKYFADYSCNKISSNVVVNCINNCWKYLPTYFVNLKNNLDTRSIRTMYFNSQGNRVLLQIMDLNLKIELKDKIVNAVKTEPLTKYSNRKWAFITRKSRTGMVGTDYNTFSEASSSLKDKQVNYVHQLN